MYSATMVTAGGLGRIAFVTGAVGCMTLASFSLTPPASSQPSFVLGRAQASSQVLAVVPSIGSARFPITLGLATASFRARTGTAEAMTVQFGFLGSLLTVSSCGADPMLTPDQLPQPLHTDSIGGPSSQTRETAGAGLGYVGRETVEARPDAFAAAESIPAGFAIPGLVRVEGRARAESELVPGELRRGGSVSELGVIELAGGLVRLEGLRWQADQITGADGDITQAAGVFTAGRLVVNGLALPAADPGELAVGLELANTALEPLFLRIDAPTTTMRKDGTVEVSPLRVTVSGGSTTSSVLQPLLGGDAGGEARRALGNALLFGGCRPGEEGTRLQTLGGAASTVADVAVATLLGGGAVTFEFGGARAGSDASTVGSAFGPPTPPVAPTGPAAGPPTVATVVPPAAGVATASTSTPAVGPPSPQSVPTRIAAAVACVSSHPARRPGCNAGRGALAATLGAVALVGIAGLDLARSRRRLPSPGDVGR